MKIGRLEIQWSLRVRWHKRSHPKKPYTGIICDICGERVKQNDKGRHIIATHPEYNIKRLSILKGVPNRGMPYSSDYYMGYECGFCGYRHSTIAYVVEHIRVNHWNEVQLYRTVTAVAIGAEQKKE